MKRVTFNRTSMESKRINLAVIRVCANYLLIEPVWNRNSFWYWLFWEAVSPFNRTSMESKQTDEAVRSRSSRLLIEPVWNRNLIYKRQSMERNDF